MVLLCINLAGKNRIMHVNNFFQKFSRCGSPLQLMQVENTFRWIDRLGIALQESILNIYSPWYMK